jgi:hypothetical protein
MTAIAISREQDAVLILENSRGSVWLGYRAHSQTRGYGDGGDITIDLCALPADEQAR